MGPLAQATRPTQPWGRRRRTWSAWWAGRRRRRRRPLGMRKLAATSPVWTKPTMAVSWTVPTAAARPLTPCGSHRSHRFPCRTGRSRANPRSERPHRMGGQRPRPRRSHLRRRSRAATDQPVKSCRDRHRPQRLPLCRHRPGRPLGQEGQALAWRCGGRPNRALHNNLRRTRRRQRRGGRRMKDGPARPFP